MKKSDQSFERCLVGLKLNVRDKKSVMNAPRGVHEMKPGSSFKTRLRYARKKLGITQAELSKAIGLTNSMICHYERGAKVPQVGILIKLSKKLKVSTDWLLGLKGPFDSV